MSDRVFPTEPDSPFWYDSLMSALPARNWAYKCLIWRVQKFRLNISQTSTFVRKQKHESRSSNVVVVGDFERHCELGRSGTGCCSCRPFRRIGHSPRYQYRGGGRRLGNTILGNTRNDAHAEHKSKLLEANDHDTVHTNCCNRDWDAAS